MRSLLIGIVAVFTACSSSTTNAPSSTGATSATSDTLDSSALFDIEHLWRIDITIDPAEWDKARKEHHPPEVFGKDCLRGPAQRPYHYVPAKLSLDGGPLVDVKLRKKGFIGSVSQTRPSLKVRFPEAHRGITRLTLNNNQQDPSQVHQCVAYRAFARAGVPAPRCNLAIVTVNGTSLGVYSNVESIKKPFLRRVFQKDTGELYEGNVSDFRPNWINTMQRKTDRSNKDRAVLNALVDSLSTPDGEVVAAVEKHIDIDEFLTFWAMERLLGQWDGYTNNLNNYYLYRRPDDNRFQFIPWGADSVFGDQDPFTRYQPPESVYATGILPYRLYANPSVRARYVARMRKMLEVWNTDAMLGEVQTLEALARPHIRVSKAAFERGLGKVRTFIKNRRAAIETELGKGAPAWEASLRSSPCAVDNGTFTASFQAKWSSTRPVNPLGMGTLTMAMSMKGTKMTFQGLGVTVESSEESRHQPTIGFYGLRTDGILVMTFVTIRPDLFTDGTKLATNQHGVSGVLLEMNLGLGSVQVVGFLGEGDIALSKAGNRDGELVEGNVSATISVPGFWLD